VLEVTHGLIMIWMVLVLRMITVFFFVLIFVRGRGEFGLWLSTDLTGILVWGGVDKTSRQIPCFGDPLWTYNLADGKWTNQTTTGARPEIRFAFAYWIVSSGSSLFKVDILFALFLFLCLGVLTFISFRYTFGGFDKTSQGYYSDLSRLAMDTYIWERIRGIPGATPLYDGDVHPGARFLELAAQIENYSDRKCNVLVQSGTLTLGECVKTQSGAYERLVACPEA